MMGFPINPTNGETYTTENGTCYQYDSTDNKWIITTNAFNYTNLSGQFVALSGNYIAVSGSFVGMSGDYVIVSGDYVNLSGSFVTLSGDYVALSGDYVNMSGDFSTTSGDLAAGGYTSLSGDFAAMSGDIGSHKYPLNGSFASDGDWNGFTLSLVLSGVVYGQCVRIHAAGSGTIALATTGLYTPTIGVCISASGVLTHGTIRDDDWNWSVPSRIFLGKDGALVDWAPTGTDEVVQIIGKAIDADTVLINPSLVEVEHE